MDMVVYNMKGGKRYGIRFLSHAQAWKASQFKKTFTQNKKAYSQKKTVVYNSPFGRLILGKCGGC